MASLRLTFPEKDQPTVIALTGARLTIGRLPFNTIQIIDRTVSGFHAELISEHGHYRLHDRGSSNGTYVNGQKVSDYHLNEACTISFGTVEAQFSPEDVASGEEAETFPSRGEVNAVRQENAEMRATVAALREEIAALRKDHKGGEGATVSREEYEQVVVERESLKEVRLRHEEEINLLRTDIAILKRDRANLQAAYDGAQREMEQLRRKLNGEEEKPALPPVEAQAVKPSPAGEVRIEVPKAGTLPLVSLPVPREPSPAAPAVPVKPATPVVPVTPIAPVSVPAETPAAAEEITAVPPPSVPAAPEPLAPAAHMPFKPQPKQQPSLPKPYTTPTAATPAPAAPTPLPKPPQAEKPAPPVNLPKRSAFIPPPDTSIPENLFTRVPTPPTASGTGVRPLPRTPGAPAAPGNVGNAGNAQPKVPPPSSATQKPGQSRPLPPPRTLPQAAAKTNPLPSPKSGPKGTQKLSE